MSSSAAAKALHAQVEQRADADAEDGALIRRVAAGDRLACDLLMRRHQRQIFALALRYVKDQEEAKDVTQRTFLQVFQQAGSFRGEAALRTWMCSIAVHLSLAAARQQRRPAPAVPAEQAGSVPPTGVERLVQEESRRRLRAALETLPHKQRLAVELRLFDELPFREVAQVAGCSEDAAKVNFHHAVKKLRDILAKEGGTR